VRRQLLPALLLPTLLFAGCSGDDDTAEDAPGAQDTSTPASTSTATPDSDSSASSPAVAATLPDEPVATVPGGEPGMVVEVYALTRSAESVTATMAVTNEALEPFTLNRQFAASLADDYRVSGITLFDPAGLKRYLVLRDTNGDCLCSDVGNGRLDTGERVSFTATFPAPPQDVDTVTVETPMGALASVPIS